MRKVDCHECGKRYDYDDDGFCPRCGAFNQPARRVSSVTRSSAAETRPRGGGKKARRQLDYSLQGMDKMLKRLLEESPKRRLPGGDL